MDGPILLHARAYLITCKTNRMGRGQTNRPTNGHGDSMIKFSQWADSMKRRKKKKVNMKIQVRAYFLANFRKLMHQNVTHVFQFQVIQTYIDCIFKSAGTQNKRDLF